jgi:hypothetical protein
MAIPQLYYHCASLTHLGAMFTPVLMIVVLSFLLAVALMAHRRYNRVDG